MARKSPLFARFALDYADHPKIGTLSDGAFRLHVTLILYARKYETDGLIKNPVANRLASQWDTDVLTELLTNDEDAPSLVKLDSGDFMLHDYADMQETKAEIAERRGKNAANGAKGGRPKKTQSVTESLTQSGTQTKAETETETYRRTSDSADAEPRPDVDSLLDHLDKCIESNGAKKPNRTKKNHDAIRLLLDRDGYTDDQVRWMIGWATSHEFWRSNILSASKLREKFDTLKAQAGIGSSKATATFGGDIDPDVILGPDYWVPGDPPDGLTMQQETEWKKQQRANRHAERIEEAKRRLNEDAAAS